MKKLQRTSTDKRERERGFLAVFILNKKEALMRIYF